MPIAPSELRTPPLATNMNRRTLGEAGEAYIARVLQARGMTIIDRNVRTPYGEIDLLAKDGDTWVFIEVKTRRGSAKGTPEDAITLAKRQRMARCAQHHLAEQGHEDDDWRLDVAAISLSHDGRLLSLDIYGGIGIEV